MIPITEANEILEICKDQDKQIESLLKMYDKQLTELINIMKGYNNVNDRNFNYIDRMSKIIEVLNKNIINLNARVMELERELEKRDK